MLQAAVRHGAAGYLLKDTPHEELIKAIADTVNWAASYARLGFEQPNGRAHLPGPWRELAAARNQCGGPGQVP